MATLLIQLPSGVSQIMKIERDRAVLGRARDADVNVPARGVSRAHCEIHKRGPGSYDIVDLGSKNGTYVNDEPVTRRPLAHNDSIILGEARLIFYADETDRQPKRPAAQRSEARPAPAPAARAEAREETKPASDPRDRSTGPPARWVESNSEILFEGAGESGVSATEPEDDDTPAPEQAARKIEELERELARARYLADALADLSRASTRQQLFERLADRLYKSFRLERVFLLRVSARPGGDMELEHLSNRADSESAAASTFRYSKRDVARVIATRKPLMVSLSADSTGGRGNVGAGLAEAGAGERGANDSYFGSGAKVAMIAPVFDGHGEPRGALQADSLGGEMTLGSKDLELFDALAEATSECLATLERRESEARFAGGTLATASAATGTFPRPAFAGSGSHTRELPTKGERYVAASGAVLLLRALPPALWSEKPAAKASAEEREDRAQQLSGLFDLADEVFDDFGGAPAGSANLCGLRFFRGRECERAAVEAAVTFLLSLTDWSLRRGGPKRAPQAGVAIARGDLVLLRDPDDGAASVECFGPPLERVLAAAPYLGVDQVVADEEVARKLGRQTEFGDLIEARLAKEAGAEAVLGRWREVAWRGGSFSPRRHPSSGH